MKACSKCKKEVPIDRFYKNGKSKDGRASQCKSCTNQTVREYVKTHRKEVAARALKRYHVNPEKQRQSSRKYHYGLSPEDYESLVREQEGKCAICLRKVELCIDHCHKTNKVRGLLCRLCNTGLGGFRDEPYLLHAAICYVYRNR